MCHGMCSRTQGVQEQREGTRCRYGLLNFCGVQKGGFPQRLPSEKLQAIGCCLGRSRCLGSQSERGILATPPHRWWQWQSWRRPGSETPALRGVNQKTENHDGGESAEHVCDAPCQNQSGLLWQYSPPADGDTTNMPRSPACVGTFVTGKPYMARDPPYCNSCVGDLVQGAAVMFNAVCGGVSTWNANKET